MARRTKRTRVLSWHAAGRCWRKYRTCKVSGRGIMHYLDPRGVSQSDNAAYLEAEQNWQAKLCRIEADERRALAQQEASHNPSLVSAMNLAHAVLDVDPSKLAGFATDYRQGLVSKTATQSGTIDESSIDGLIEAYLLEKRQDAESGQRSAKTYAEHKSKLDDFKLFADCLGVEAIAEVDAELIGRYRTEQVARLPLGKLDGGISPATAKKRLACVKRFLEWCYAREALDRLPRNLDKDYARITVPKRKPRFYSPDECQELFAAATSRTRLYMALALNTGATQVDIATLQHEHVDWREGVITRPRNKTGVEGKWKLWPVTLKLLRRHATKGPKGLVLVGENGLPLVRDSIKPDGNIALVDAIKLAFNRLVLKVSKEKVRAANPELAETLTDKSKQARERAKRKLDALARELAADGRGFSAFRKSASNEIEKQYQDAPHLSSLFLSHAERATKAYYVDRHFDLLFQAIEYLDGLYDLNSVG